MAEIIDTASSLVFGLPRTFYSGSDQCSLQAGTYQYHFYNLLQADHVRKVAVSEHISIVEASYVTNIAIIFAGVSPLIWSPISNIYGRRPIFIFVTIIGIIAHCASGAAKSWGGILVARAFVGIGTSAGMGIGAAVVSDLYFLHERKKHNIQRHDNISTHISQEVDIWAYGPSLSPTEHTSLA